MKHQKWIAAGVCIFVGLISTAYAAEQTKDSLETVKKMLADKKAVLLDVRENDEWNAGHLKDAVHFPLSQIKQGVTAEQLNKIAGKETVIYLHCKAGARALDAATRLENTKRDLRPLPKGYEDLLNAGFPKAK